MMAATAGTTRISEMPGLSGMNSTPQGLAQQEQLNDASHLETHESASVSQFERTEYLEVAVLGLCCW